MRFFDKEKETPEEILERVSVENQIDELRGQSFERKLLEKQLKKKYGRNWRDMIGNAKDNDTMRQFASFGAGFDISKIEKNRDVHTGDRRRIR